MEGPKRANINLPPGQSRGQDMLRVRIDLTISGDVPRALGVGFPRRLSIAAFSDRNPLPANLHLQPEKADILRIGVMPLLLEPDIAEVRVGFIYPEKLAGAVGSVPNRGSSRRGNALRYRCW
jgi:hypothetical protein